MRTRFFPLLLLIAALFPSLACSSQQGTQQPEPGSAAANATAAASATPPAAASSAAELEPVMPEKVQVAFERNCKSCHGPDGHGITNVAPDLRRAPRRSLREWISFMKDQKGTHSDAKIPAMAALTDEDFEALGGYLADLTQNNAPAVKK